MAAKEYKYFSSRDPSANPDEKKGFVNYPRSNRIIWVLTITGILCVAFVLYNLNTRSGARVGGVDQPVKIIPATGEYSDFDANLKAVFSEDIERRQALAAARSASLDSARAVIRPAPAKNVKIVQKPPSQALSNSRNLLFNALAAPAEVTLKPAQTMGQESPQTESAVITTEPAGYMGYSSPEELQSEISRAARVTAPNESPPVWSDVYDPFRQNSPDPNASAMAHQDRNNDFVKANTGTANDRGEYLSSVRRAPRGKYELKAGSIISGVLVGGINSDTPGAVLGQITENVYDTASGAYLLIPQGARMVGAYDSHVVYGQNRVLVVWQRIVYPDGSSLNLEGMLGGDQAGNAGFKQKVDNHYSRMIGAALFASVFAAAGKIATDNDKDSDGSETKAAEAVMESMTSLGARLAERNINVSPTLRILPGYRFSIVTTKDIAFAEPYEL
ncbi:MAG: hypothetical protein LBQ19_01155 [Synergistaceae bacterium]|jgi:type IV secretion system protein VirB10|nr:hypothetical protein [Synergistaceae bacterium]